MCRTSSSTHRPVFRRLLQTRVFRTYISNGEDGREFVVFTRALYSNIPMTIKLSILFDVSLGLRYLHSRKILHRDLSSNNILLTALLRAKIGDLGVAKVVKVDNKKSLTQVPGTADFMPPEAQVDMPIYDASLDVFSYGGVVFHTATQKWPAPSARMLAIPKDNRSPKYFTTCHSRRRGLARQYS